MLAFVLGINSGDPLGELRLRPNVPQAVIRAREAHLHLSAGFFGRYWFWFSHVLRGDFGTNNDGLPVRHIVWTHLLVTARLVSLADCGHFSFLECPSDVRAALDEFFRRR